MKIELIDKVLKQYDLDMNKHYKVIRTETVQDDLYYIVINETGNETEVHELLAREVTA